jgi:hypothetical protein
VWGEIAGVIDLHLQGIFSEILEEPRYLAGQLDGSIEQSVQRKREWELILVWVLTAAVAGFISAKACAVKPRAMAPSTMRLTTIFDIAEFSSRSDSFDPTALRDASTSGRLLRFVELSRVDDGAGGRMC